MRINILFLFSLLVLVWGTRIYAQADDTPTADPVLLTEEQDSYPLGLHLEILEDPSGELTIEDVASPEYNARFVPSKDEVPNYGFTDSAYWARLRLRSETPMPSEWLMDIGFANMQFVDLYSPSQSGRGFDVEQSGSLRHVSTRDIPYHRVVFELTPPAQGEQVYYLRFKNDASMTLQLTLWSPGAFLAHVQWDLLRYGLFFGVMLGLLGYNLFLLFSLREKSYLFLTLFIANMIFHEASYAGFLETFVFPDLYTFKTLYHPLLFSLIFVWSLLFCYSFLQVKAQIPRLHWPFIVILVVWGVLNFSVPFASYGTLAPFMVSWGILSMAALLVTGIISLRQGFRPVRFFIVAWFGLAVSVILVLLVRLGLASSTAFNEGVYHLGIMWMVICWSIALADRINLLKTETEQANYDLRNSEHRLSEILEGVPLGIVLYEKDYKPHYINQRVVEILGNLAHGIEPDISAGRTLAQAMSYYAFRETGSDQTYPLERMPVHRALQGEPASADDIEADLVDRRVPLEIWANPVRDNEGNVEAAVVAFQDISSRKQAERALRASESRFRAVVENNFDGVVFMTRDRHVLYASPAYGRIVGMSVEEMTGQLGVNYVHPDDQARIAQVFAELIQKPGNRITVEYRSKHRDGSWFWVETNAMNLLDDPHVKAVVLNIRNITERKESEARLAEYRRGLEVLVEERTTELSKANERLGNEIIEREALETLLQQHIDWLRTLNHVRQSIGGSADLSRAYEELTAAILKLLHSREVVLVDWSAEGRQFESVSKQLGDSPSRSLAGIGAIIRDEPSLRLQLETGKLVAISAKDAVSLTGSLRDYFQDDGSHSLVLAPLMRGQLVSGVLGISAHRPLPILSPSWAELVETMASDLGELAENAQLLDRAKALSATEERNRLARDLHDSVTQVLFSASLVAEVLPKIWRRDPDRALESLVELRRLTHGALAEMRTMLLELRPASVLKTPLHELLAQLTEAITSRNGLPFQLNLEQIPSLPEDVHTSFYRIAQEALNNVVKHAQATTVSVGLSASHMADDRVQGASYQVELVIDDDGVGFSPLKEGSAHMGTGIMQERAAAIAADLYLVSQLGHGTRVTVHWPSFSENTS